MRVSLPAAMLVSVGSLCVLAACPGPKMPSGPPPEYEQPPPPSWLNDAGPEASAPAPAPPSAPPEDGGIPSV